MFPQTDMTTPEELQTLYEADADTLHDELRALWADQDDFEVEVDADVLTVRAGPFVAEFAIVEDDHGPYPEDIGVATYEADDEHGYRLVEGVEVDAWDLADLPGALHKAVGELDRPDPDKRALAEFRRKVL